MKRDACLDKVVRLRRSWRKEDSIVALAAFLERPAGFRLPPDEECQRVANLLRVPVEMVKERMDGYARLAAGERIERRTDTQLWMRYHDDPFALAAEADWVLEQRRWRPKWLFKDG